MKSSKEFFEKYNADGEFKREVDTLIKKLKVEGTTSLFTAVVKIAETFDYSMTEDEVREYRKSRSGELSDDLLADVSGGFIC